MQHFIHSIREDIECLIHFLYLPPFSLLDYYFFWYLFNVRMIFITWFTLFFFFCDLSDVTLHFFSQFTPFFFLHDSPDLSSVELHSFLHSLMSYLIIPEHMKVNRRKKSICEGKLYIGEEEVLAVCC
jgi:hypothetical protein